MARLPRSKRTSPRTSCFSALSSSNACAKESMGFACELGDKANGDWRGIWPKGIKRGSRFLRQACCNSVAGTTSFSPGFIQKAAMEPRKSRTMLPRKGNSQLLVLSITTPKTMGERMAAKADPKFMSPLADPENWGAISIGIAHIGPTVNSEKKKPRLRKIEPDVRLWENKIGIMQAREQRKLITTRSRRALLKFPVLRKILSLTIPPNESPNTPAKKTPAENIADSFRLRR